MEALTTIDLNLVWLSEPEYTVKPLNPSLACFTRELKRALRTGCVAEADSNRPGFYQINLTGVGMRAYIYVRDETSTVYLIAAA